MSNRLCKKKEQKQTKKEPIVKATGKKAIGRLVWGAVQERGKLTAGTGTKIVKQRLLLVIPAGGSNSHQAQDLQQMKEDECELHT